MFFSRNSGIHSWELHEYIEHALSMVEVFERCPLDVSLDTNELKQHDKMFIQEPFNRIHPRQGEIVKCFVEMPKADFIREISYMYDFLAEYKDDFYNATDGIKKNILENGIKIWARSSWC